MLELIRKHLFRGIGWGCTFIILDFIVGDLIGYEYVITNFTFYVLTSILITMGFVSTAIVYEFESLSQKMKISIHLTVALILLIVGNLVIYNTFYISNALFYLSLFLTVWTFHYLRERREIRKINERIQQLKR